MAPGKEILGEIQYNILLHQPFTTIGTILSCADEGFPETGSVFCCFNNNYKGVCCPCSWPPYNGMRCHDHTATGSGLLSSAAWRSKGK